jgi:hypothetical protein
MFQVKESNNAMLPLEKGFREFVMSLSYLGS